MTYGFGTGGDDCPGGKHFQRSGGQSTVWMRLESGGRGGRQEHCGVWL